MKLQNIKLEEIEPFFDSLTGEKELMRLPLKDMLGSEFITGVRVSDKLAGIAGILTRPQFMPACFFVVKSEYQGKGLGNQLGKDILEYTRMKYDFLTLYTMETEEYEPARRIYHKLGFRTFYPFYRKRRYQKLHQCWMSLNFNRKGKLICKLLPIIYPLSPYLSLKFWSQILWRVGNRLFRPGGNR